MGSLFQILPHIKQWD